MRKNSLELYQSYDIFYLNKIQSSLVCKMRMKKLDSNQTVNREIQTRDSSD